MSAERIPDWIKGLGSIVLVILVPWCWFLGMLSPMEGKVPFDPYIDTEMAPGYSPDKNGLIRSGMSREEVWAIIGQPLGYNERQCGPDRKYVMEYTDDGAYRARCCAEQADLDKSKDFAWRHFGVAIDTNDRVVEIIDYWSYD
jgi:hypothetical protein